MDKVTERFLSGFDKSIRSFTPSLRQTYSKIMMSFLTSPETVGFEAITTDQGFEDPTAKGVAHRMYWWFPTHFYKFQDALLRWEKTCQKDNKPFLLKRSEVTFIDLGCGAGAASVAVLSVLEQYQIYLEKLNLRIDPISVNLIGVDPCQPELDTYIKVLTEYSSLLKQQKIHINVQTLCHPFPEKMGDLLTQLNAYKGHALIIGMSNLINWIWNEADSDLREGKHENLVKLQSLEIEALKELSRQADFEIFYVIGTATINRKLYWLPEKLSQLFEKFLNLLLINKRPFSELWKETAQVLFENPEGSRKSKDKATASSKFFVETVSDISPDFENDKKYRNILSLPRLEMAWVKAQNWINYEALVDRVELKLFEIDYETELEKLRLSCLEKKSDYLNTAFDLPYEFPKSKKANRPKSLPRLEEQIVAGASAIEFKKELFGKYSDISFSFQLAPDNSEFLYQYWFQQYSEYVTKILSSVADNLSLELAKP